MSPARVILVHGTGASSIQDRGERWWQLGGPVSKALAERLPRSVRLHRDGEVFHWSGENSERERIRAGRNLLEYLKDLEARGEDYHLVGHSHGGSVIWHAMRMAHKAGARLQHLRSWTTVGTPFLHYRSRSAWSTANLLNAMMAVLLIRPAVAMSQQLGRLIISSVYGVEFYDRSGRARVDGLTALLQAPFIRLLHWLGVPVTTTESGFQIGQYSPQLHGSVAQYLLTTREGWLIVGVCVLALFVFLNLARLTITPLMESFYHWADRRLERKLMREYGDRWLAIWSPEDEAINALRSTLSLSLEVLPRLTASEPVLFSDHLSVLARPYLWFLYPLYNRVVRPLFNEWICKSIARAAQGDNRPAAEIVAVSPSPVAKYQRTAFLALPEHLNSELVERADFHARSLAPALRNLIANSPLINGIDSVADLFTGKELVHTSYFDHPGVLDLVAMNIAFGCSPQVRYEALASQDPELRHWFLQCKRIEDLPALRPDAVGEPRVANGSVDKTPTHRPRRRAA